MIATRHIRWTLRADMDPILAIERMSQPDPLDLDQLLRYMQQANYIAYVTELPGGIVGWMLYELGKRRFTVHRIAVMPDFRMHGHGRAMLDKLAGKLGVNGRRKRIRCDVADDNLEGHLFLSACGFRATRVLGDSYRFVRGRE